MKFSATTLLVILPLLAAQASALAVPESGFARRAGNAKGGQGGRGSFGGNGGKGAAAGAGAIAGAGAGVAAAGAAAKGKGGAAANSTSSAAGSAATAAASNATAANGAAANATAAAAGGGDPQTSLTLDPAVIASNFAQDGNETPAAGQVPSLTSTNNFINFCIDKGEITNGQQIQAGSCNPAPMGQIPPTTQMPSAKFQFPVNMQDIAANTAFTIKMGINGMQTGVFVNAEKSYFAAPQQLNAQQQIIGHSHVVIELLTSLTQTTTSDPTKFAFFQGLNSAAVGGVLTADVTSGLPAGAYKLSSINTAGNHQPCLVPVAQHGSLDDAVYFTVGGGGAGASNATAGAGAGAANSTDAAGAASTSAATGGKGGAAAAAASSAAAVATGAAKGGAGGKAGAGGAGGFQGGANGGKGKQGRRFIREAY